MPLDHYLIGDYEIIRIPETCEPAVAPSSFYPELERDVLDRDADWADPVFYSRASDKVVLSTHTWLIRTPRFNVLFELGAGNGKERPNFPRAHRLNTNWLDNLRATGLDVADIDFLYPSHLHVDHVGWFTTFEGGEWRPTFPNARALITRRELDNWTPGKRSLPFPRFNEGVLEDSVYPLVQRGMVDVVEDGHRIDRGLTIEPMVGHTMGHAGLLLDLGSEGAVFCGDTMYSPLQLVHHRLNAYADEAPDACRATRLSLLRLCAGRGFRLFPSHFPEPFSGVKVSEKAGAFSFTTD